MADNFTFVCFEDKFLVQFKFKSEYEKNSKTFALIFFWFEILFINVMKNYEKIKIVVLSFRVNILLYFNKY